MKIFYLANIRFPSERAHAVQIGQMCQAFSEIGVEVVLVVNKRVQIEKQALEEWFGAPLKFSILRISHGIFISGSRLAFILSELYFTCSFLITAKRSTDDLLYSRSEWIIFFLSFFSSADKFVWESHEAKYNVAAQSIIKKNVKLVVISEGIRDFYVQHGVSSEQILVAHDGIDNSFYEKLPSKSEARENLGLPHDAKIAMYIGGFDTWKGVETFFKASELLPDVQCVAIGGKHHEIEQYQRKYPYMTFLGSIPYKELKKHQQAADVLVIPNTAKTALSAQYTSPLKLFAHMSSKIPMVVSNIPSLKNILNEDQGFFFDTDNPDALAQKIHEVVGSIGEAEKRAHKAYDLSKKYTWKTRAEDILAFIS